MAMKRAERLEEVPSLYARWADLESSRRDLSEDMKSLFADARADGLNPRALRVAFKEQFGSENDDEDVRVRKASDVAAVQRYSAAIEAAGVSDVAPDTKIVRTASVGPAKGILQNASHACEVYDPETGEVLDEKSLTQAVGELQALAEKRALDLSGYDPQTRTWPEERETESVSGPAVAPSRPDERRADESSSPDLCEESRERQMPNEGSKPEASPPDTFTPSGVPAGTAAHQSEPAPSAAPASLIGVPDDAIEEAVVPPVASSTLSDEEPDLPPYLDRRHPRAA